MATFMRKPSKGFFKKDLLEMYPNLTANDVLIALAYTIAKPKSPMAQI